MGCYKRERIELCLDRNVSEIVNRVDQTYQEQISLQDFQRKSRSNIVPKWFGNEGSQAWK